MIRFALWSASLASCALLASLASCALYTGVDPPDEPAAISVVTELDVPAFAGVDVDVLFVIDDSPAMAPARDHVVASLPAFGDVLEHTWGRGLYHVGVATADPADGGRLVGPFASVQWYPDGTSTHDYPGTLAEVLTGLGDVGVQGSDATAPLEAMTRAIAPDVNPGFRRPDAALFVIPITNRDDESEGAIDDYAAALAGGSDHDVLVSGIYARPAARLDALLDALPDVHHHFTSLDDADLAPAIAAVRELDLVPLVGPPCFEAKLVQPFRCVMSDVTGGVEQPPYPRCDEAVSNRTCWRIAPDLVNCLQTDQLALRVERSIFAPRDTHLIAQCEVANSSDYP